MLEPLPSVNPLQINSYNMVNRIEICLKLLSNNWNDVKVTEQIDSSEQSSVAIYKKY